MSCDQATLLISQRAERPLGRAQWLEVWIHALMCSGCRLFGRQVVVLNRMATNYSPGRDEPRP